MGQVQDYAIIALDPQGTIETWNLGAERVKGYTAEEAIGRSFSMFYPEEDRRAGLPLQLLAKARDTGRVEHNGWRVRKDGTRFWGDVVITAMHDDNGQLTGYAKVTRDRTDLKALWDAQDAFYAAFTHDFRTPVAALMGYVDAIRDATDEERPDLIDRVETNAQRLLDMVGGLVEFATERASHSALLMDDIDAVEWCATPSTTSRRARPCPGEVLGDVTRGQGQRGRAPPGGHQPRGQRAEVLTGRAARWRSPSPTRATDGCRSSSPTRAVASIPPTCPRSSRSSTAAGSPSRTAAPASVWPASVSWSGRCGHRRIESTVGVGTTVTLDLPAGNASREVAPRPGPNGAGRGLGPLRVGRSSNPTGHWAG